MEAFGCACLRPDALLRPPVATHRRATWNKSQLTALRTNHNVPFLTVIAKRKKNRLRTCEAVLQVLASSSRSSTMSHTGDPEPASTAKACTGRNNFVRARGVLSWRRTNTCSTFSCGDVLPDTGQNEVLLA